MPGKAVPKCSNQFHARVPLFVEGVPLEAALLWAVRSPPAESPKKVSFRLWAALPVTADFRGRREKKSTLVDLVWKLL